MNIEITKQPSLQRGYALMIVMILGGASLLILAAAMSWTSTNSSLIERNNQYFTSVAAAEAATEMVLSELASDFQNRGAVAINSKMSAYRSRLPGAAQDGYWGNFQFSDANGNKDANSVFMMSPWQTSLLVSQYRGLSGFTATYRVTSNAKQLNSRIDVVGAVRQDVQLATVPIFQFAIFYNMDLEINPGPDMIVTGRVHSNGKIYTQPESHLTFLGDVTSAQDIIADKKPGDPLMRANGTVTYKQPPDSGVNSMNLPIGKDNSSDSVRALIEIPPNTEAADSQTGQQRYYNNSDLTILVYDDRVEVDCGPAKGKFPNLLWGGVSGVSNFANINASFYNGREGKVVKATEIDVGKFIAWNNNPLNPLRTSLGRDVESVYVADLRSQSGTEPGVRLINGQTLPPLGLTVATPDPLYVLGNYNVPPGALGTPDTSQAKPASLIADSINILSVDWKDDNSELALNKRLAGDTTVNAAFLAGVVPTTDGSYSGGVENFPRFLEDWGGITFTFNGSMVVMYTSKVATAPWSGATDNYYSPPRRRWTFDNNFLDPTKQPPLTPAFRTVIRGQWTTVAPGT